MILTSVAPTVPLVLASLMVLGAASIAFRSTATALVQLAARPSIRGRVMSLLAAVVLGCGAVGGPLLGWLWLAEVLGVRSVSALGE